MPRGRPTGSNGYVTVAMSELNAKFGPTALIPIRTSFARQVFPNKIVIVRKNQTILPTESPEKPLTKLEESSKLNFIIIQPK